MAFQDINYEEVSQLCPGILKDCADQVVNGLRSGLDENLPLHIIAKKFIHKYKDKPDCKPTEQKLREAIVEYYDKDGNINKQD